MIRLNHVYYTVENSASNQNIPVLEDIHLEFSKGTVYAIVGANGTGKSTLLDIISGTKVPTKGMLENNEKDVHKSNSSFLEYIEKVSYCVQNPETAFFHKTVYDELLFSSQNKHLLDFLIQQYDLKELLDLSPFQLSGGEKKRLLFVLNLLNEPTILLTDELTAGLDRKGKQMIMEDLLIHKNERITIMVTHNLEDALCYADSLIILSDKTVTYAGCVRDVIKNISLLTSVGFQMPETFEICHNLIQAGIFQEEQYYFNGKKIAKELLSWFKGVNVDG